MSKITVGDINPVTQAALVLALPILAFCLDNETKSRIKAAVESHEQAFQESDNPLLMETLKHLRHLLNVE